MSPTVLVTGPTGKTGRRLVPLLVEHDVTVRTAHRTPVPASVGTEPVHFDWSDESTYAGALKGVDAVYVIPGGLTTPGDPAEQVRSLLERALDAGAARAVLLSAFGVDRAPAEDPLRRVELAAEASGVPITIVRPGAFMQNFSEPHWSRHDESIRERDEIVMPGGEARTSWVSTVDIASVAAVALTEDGHGGKGYQVTGPSALTMPEVAEHISRATGRRINYIESGQEQVRAALLAAGAPDAVADEISRFYTFVLNTGAFGAITDDVATVTGRPPITFADYAAGAADAWRR